MPSAGNTLTVREYQAKWLELYNTKFAASVLGTCTGATPTEDGYALPLDRNLIAANPSVLDQPHHDYPAIDLMVPEGSPVYAVRAGTVARVVDWPHNCYQYGRCDQTCGIGLSINGDDGARYIYCHGSRLNGLAVGDTVAAADLLMWSGNTGRSGGPHLHLEIRVDGIQRCPQQLLQQLFANGAGPRAADLPATGCSF
ncbi:MAG: M23 family metallopeptidase [Ilumatobacteraceae bacterium]